MRVVLFGATKGMARALARRLANRGDRLFLLGRDQEDLDKSARDLEARGAGQTPAPANLAIGTARCDLAEPTTFAPALAAARQALGGLDVVVVTAAQFAPQATLADDPVQTAALLDANFTATVLFCEEARKQLLTADTSGKRGGTLCVFSSVAGERGRKPVVLYGASKAGLSYYLEALDHAYHQQGLRVVTVKPGFVRTTMTAGLPEPPFAGDPDGVAKIVARAIDRGTPVVYAPKIWGLVMFVIRLLPRFVMRRINF